MQEPVSVLQVVLKHISVLQVACRWHCVYWLCAMYGDTLIPTYIAYNSLSMYC